MVDNKGKEGTTKSDVTFIDDFFVVLILVVQLFFD